MHENFAIYLPFHLKSLSVWPGILHRLQAISTQVIPSRFRSLIAITSFWMEVQTYRGCFKTRLPPRKSKRATVQKRGTQPVGWWWWWGKEWPNKTYTHPWRPTWNLKIGPPSKKMENPPVEIIIIYAVPCYFSGVYLKLCFTWMPIANMASQSFCGPDMSWVPM